MSHTSQTATQADRSRALSISLAASALLAVASPLALGQVHTSDVVLRVEQGRLTTSAVVTGTGSQLTPQSVFVVELLDFSPLWFANDPGFDSVSGTFSPGARVGLQIKQALRTWDGAGFSTIAAQQVARLSLGPQRRLSPASDDLAVPALYASASGTGQFHLHFGFALLSQPDDTIEPPDGLYLLTLRGVSETSAFTPSADVHMLLNKNAANQQLQSAIATLIPPTACPADIAGPGQAIGADGSLTADDIIVYLGWFFATDTRANIAGPGQSPVPDADFTADDIIVFLSRFFAGC